MRHVRNDTNRRQPRLGARLSPRSAATVLVYLIIRDENESRRTVPAARFFG
jgi:hypothetical protein